MTKSKIKAGIVGGAGYTGGELMRLLLHHPYAELSTVHSRSNAGKPVGTVHADLLGETDIVFADVIDTNVDVLFLCLSHGEAKNFLSGNRVASEVKVIDLSQDFRLKSEATFNDRHFVYGLPELNKEEIKGANSVANPGCFATAIQLGLLPIAAAGLLTDVYATGITGSTGAGQSLSPTSHFSWRANNIQAYKTLSHQHLAEIDQSFQQLQPNNKTDLCFVPWRGDFTRGIFVSSQLDCDLKKEALVLMYREYYAKQPFITINQDAIFLKQVINTNKCVLQLEKIGSKLVVHTAIDNLLKGACGQAVQNMNLMFGFREDCGLRLKASVF